MGCDIHMTCQRLVNGKWEELPNEYSYRNYGLFGFLANVRNYSFVPTLASRRGYPADFEHEENSDHHSASWYNLLELTQFDYWQVFEDRRCTKQVGFNAWDAASDVGKGNGKIVTYREFLGENWFKFLERLQKYKDDQNIRIVFDFDC